MTAILPLLAPMTATAGLIVHLPLDDDSGLTLANGAAITSGSQGKFGEAASFDGTDDWAQVNSGIPTAITGRAVRTVAVWVNQTAGATLLRTPVALGGNGNGSKWDVDIDNANGGIEVGIGNGRVVDSGLSGLTGSWSLIVTTLPVASGNIQNVRTWWNGQARTNTTAQTQAVNTSATNPLAGTSFRLGTSANNNTANTVPSIQFFSGLVDDVAIWDEVLSAGEIKSLYDVGSSGVLSYTAAQFDQLKQIHDVGSGSVTLKGIAWMYAAGLTGTAGLSGGGGSFTLVLDETAGTGLTGTITAQGPFEITSVSPAGASALELKLIGPAGATCEFRSSPSLQFAPGALVENLTQASPGSDPGTIGGANNSRLTLSGTGNATVRIPITGNGREFFRGEIVP